MQQPWLKWGGGGRGGGDRGVARGQARGRRVGDGVRRRHGRGEFSGIRQRTLEAARRKRSGNNYFMLQVPAPF